MAKDPLELAFHLGDQDLQQFKEAYAAYLNGSLSPKALYNVTNHILGKYGKAFEAARILNLLERYHKGYAQ
ncbi:MAG: hypothetical protein ACLFRN_07225 [Halothece sp.]